MDRVTRWRWLQTVLNRLLAPVDRWRWWTAALLGLALGGAATAAGLLSGPGATVAAVGAVLGLAVPLALSGEAVADERGTRRKRPAPVPLQTVERAPVTTAPEPVRAELASLVETVSLPGGTYRMGSPESEEGHQADEQLHEVAVSPFVIMTAPVTRGLWKALRSEERGHAHQGDHVPVTDVSWVDAVQFCNALSRREGRPECYSGEGKKWTCDWSAGGYRLPTEAEWEYACRAGSRARFCFGDDKKQLGAYAWFIENSQGKLHPVKTRRPNEWGVFDMHGNVWEWCWDWYQSEYETDQTTNPIGPPAGRSRVMRGGSFGGTGAGRAAPATRPRRPRRPPPPRPPAPRWLAPEEPGWWRRRRWQHAQKGPLQVA